MFMPVQLHFSKGAGVTCFISYQVGNGSGPATAVNAKAAQAQNRVVRRISCFTASVSPRKARRSSGFSPLSSGKISHPPYSKPPRPDKPISVVEKTQRLAND